MKVQAITMIAVMTGFVGSNQLQANDFIKVIRTINAIDHVVNGPNHGPIGPPVIGQPHPGHLHPNPIHCKPPVPVCPHCHGPVCHCHKPPLNKPPVKKFTMQLLNNAETQVFFSLNGLDYQMLEADGVELVKSIFPKTHSIKFHNGVEMVEFDLDPTAIYSFEWENEVLLLLEIQG